MSLILVSGAGSGIGAATTKALVQAGFAVVATDLRPPEPTLPEIVCWPAPLDVTDPVAVQREVAAIEERLGPITGLVNAAGILGKMHTPDRIRLENWNRELAVDLTGTFLMCREVGLHMTRRGRGSIVNVASIAGMTSVPAHAYGAAKAGVIQLTATLATAWGRRGVRVNAVSPGFTRTPALVAGLDAGALDLVRLTGVAALGRLVEPEEVGQAITWLIGPGSSAITGVNLPVDAGVLAAAGWPAYVNLEPPEPASTKLDDHDS